jgi:hypothetical protein
MDTVPTELGALILSNVADVGSLWAFVRASRRIYFLFNEYRERILSDVIAREIGPALMGEALAALSSSRFTSDHNGQGENTQTFIRGLPKSEALAWIENCYIPKSNAFQWVENFLLRPDKLKWSKMNDRKRANHPTILPPSKDMLLLWELHKDVKFLAERYVGETLHNFSHTLPETTQVPNTLESLSTVEKERIFRAIYRFVIFGNLFAPSRVSRWHEEELCEYFLCRFTAWQVEEIRCINDFVIDTILKKWQEMEDNEFNRLAADSSLWEIDPRPDPWNCRWDADFFSKLSKSISFKDKQEFVATLPIKDLRAIFQAEGQILEDLVIKWAWGGRYEIGPFLGKALKVDPQSFPIIPDGQAVRQNAHQIGLGWGTMPSFDRATDGNDATSANTGWYWANNWHVQEVYGDTSNSTDSLGYEDSEGFRRFGYVFWDSQRWGSIRNRK